MAAPRARLAAPRRRPAAAGGRSLPPSCCGKTRALGEEGGLLLRLRLGREPGHRRARRGSAGGEGDSQAPNEEAAGERLGKGQPDSLVPPTHPTPTPALPPLTTGTPRRRGRGQPLHPSTRGIGEQPRSCQKGAPSTLEPGLEGVFCLGIPPQPNARLSPPVRCPLLPENRNVHHLRPPIPRFPLLTTLFSRFLFASFLLACWVAFLFLASPLHPGTLLPVSLTRSERGTYFVPSLWLLSTGDSLGAKAALRVAGSRE